MATHWKKLANQDYIGAYALQPGEDLTVTIRTVIQQEVNGAGGRKQECIVAVLEGQKPLILKATNSKSISKLYGPYIEDWAGKQITLYASTTSLAGEVVECLRIRPTIKLSKTSLNDARFDKALASIEAGTFSIDDLLKKYDLTEDQIAKLPVTEEVANA
jgi:hypothetical protein